MAFFLALQFAMRAHHCDTVRRAVVRDLDDNQLTGTVSPTLYGQDAWQNALRM